MFTVKRSFIAGLAAASLVATGFCAPAVAAPQSLPGVTAKRLDAAETDYTGYRGRGARNAAIAGAIGLGVLGLAAGAAAANRADYGPVYEYDPYPVYGHGRYRPVYEEPVIYERRVYVEPGYHPYPRQYYPRSYYPGVDPARSSR